jgi:hypothetical protein
VSSDQAESIAIGVLVTGQRRVCQNLTQPSRNLKSAARCSRSGRWREKTKRRVWKAHSTVGGLLIFASGSSAQERVRLSRSLKPENQWVLGGAAWRRAKHCQASESGSVFRSFLVFLRLSSSSHFTGAISPSELHHFVPVHIPNILVPSESQTRTALRGLGLGSATACSGMVVLPMSRRAKGETRGDVKRLTAFRLAPSAQPSMELQELFCS